MSQTTSTTPFHRTVVLVRGASRWNGVIEPLQARGVTLTPHPPTPCAALPALPPTLPACSIRSPAQSSTVGHSDGGAVIANIARTARNVVALVFVAAFAIVS